MKRFLLTLGLIALSVTVLVGAFTISTNWVPFGTGKGDTLMIKSRANGGSDTIKSDTAGPLNLGVNQKIVAISVNILSKREATLTKLKKPADSLTVRLYGEDYFGNWISLLTVMAYDSTLRYNAADSLKKGYWSKTIAVDTNLQYQDYAYLATSSVSWIGKRDSVSGGRHDTLSSTLTPTNTFSVITRGQGWQLKYKRLWIIVKCVAHDSTASIDTIGIKAQAITE